MRRALHAYGNRAKLSSAAAAMPASVGQVASKAEVSQKIGLVLQEESMLQIKNVIDDRINLFRSAPDFAIPEVRFSQLECGHFPNYVARQINRRGVVVVRECVPEPTALRWKESVLEYLLQNKQWVKPPAIHNRYWSHAQLQARENVRLNIVLRALNGLWHASSGHAPLNLNRSLSYCDRLFVGKPTSMHGRRSMTNIPNTDKSISSCGAYMSGGAHAMDRWLHPRLQKAYRCIHRGTWGGWDPFECRDRVALASEQNANPNANPEAPFTPWQGFMSLAPWLHQGGNLRVVPMMRVATAYTLLKPFSKDVEGDENWCGAELCGPGDPMPITSKYHQPLLDALVPLPPLFPGDAVFWHMDTIVEETASQALDREYVGLFVGSMPMCVGNSAYLERQRRVFKAGGALRGGSARNSQDESDFVERATLEDLTDDGRQAMGLLPWVDDEMDDALREHHRILGF